MRKVFVTGGAGYLGYSIITELVANPTIAQVTIYDNLSSGSRNFFFQNQNWNKDKLTFIQGDILDNHSLVKSLSGHDTVIHLAAKASTPFADHNAHSFDQVNNWGTSIVVQAAEQDEGVDKFIFFSSISVYGNTAGEVINEDAITAPKSFYGISKLSGERHVDRLLPKMKTYIYRVGNVFGYNPCIRLNAVVNRFMFDAQFKGKIEIQGNGNQKRAFTSVECIGKFMQKHVNESNHEPGLYNLVNYNLSILNLADKIKNLYPELEMMYVDQHLDMRSIAAESKYGLLLEDCFQTMDDHLISLKNQFSF